MSHLLDTHALLFFLNEADRLTPIARAILADRSNPIFVSAVSLYEIGLKRRLGKLRGAERFLAEWRTILAAESFDILDVSADHAVVAAAFPSTHRDPFDRILAAQALVGGLIVLSADTALDGFGVGRVW